MFRTNGRTSLLKDGDERRSSRRVSISPTNDNSNANVADTPMAKKLRYSPRNFKCCTDIAGLPIKIHCSGCVAYKDFGTKPREEYTTIKYQCFQGWKKKADTVKPSMSAHVLSIQKFIENHLHVSVSSFQDESLDNDVLHVEQTPATAAPITPSVSTPKPRNITFETNEVHSQGQVFEFQIPTTHRIVHKNYLSRLERESVVLSNVRQKLQQSQYQTDSIFAQSLWAIALAACPALATSAAQFFVPIVFWAFLYDTGLFDYRKFDRELFAKSFPSDNTLRKYSLIQATRDTMLLGRELRNTKIYLSCDKGNKKGIGHFVKYVSRWLPAGRVDKRLLDIDASGGSSVECAAGIQSSINKLKLNDDDRTHLLYGTATDSGGGGTLESLYEKLSTLELCAPAEEYLISNCCIHALQLQLKNAICAAFGEGALDKINAMQLLHSAYRLQMSIDLDEWRHILYLSSEFVLTYNPDSIDDGELTAAQQRNRSSFYEKYNHVLTFHSAFKKEKVNPESTARKKTVLSKMTAPILTRWWTVGAGASYVFDYYLVLFHACQTVINMYDSTSTPNGIASDLFSMMSNQEIFIDVALIRSFHKVYINPHFDWMQTCQDLTHELGFQAHNIAIRFHLMDRDLAGSMMGDSVKDYFEAVNKACPIGSVENTRHMNKLTVFGREAIQSLHKHFPRWVSHKLLPSALLSEGPTAKVVAAAMLGLEMPTFETTDGVIDDRRVSGKLYFLSDAHGVEIDLLKFDRFIRAQMETSINGEYTALARAAAERVINKVKLRDINYSDDHGELRWYMHSTFLPVASMLQFVESGVKEAKYVSATDRSEVIRSCLAIIRSATPLGKSKLLEPELSFTVNKILGIIQSAMDRAEPHNQWKANQDNRWYDARIAQVLYSMKQGHFRDERIDIKRAKVDDLGSKFKRPNIHQQPKQQTLTAAVTGLIPYGKLTKGRNMSDLEEELLFRHVPIEEIPALISERKDMLRHLEIERLTAEGVREDDAARLKTFKIQSNAAFKLTD